LAQKGFDFIKKDLFKNGEFKNLKGVFDKLKYYANSKIKGELSSFIIENLSKLNDRINAGINKGIKGFMDSATKAGGFVVCALKGAGISF